MNTARARVAGLTAGCASTRFFEVNMSEAPQHQQSTIDLLETRRSRVMMELHPDLRARVVQLLADMGGRVTPWEGFRSPADQNAAFAHGASAARAGESPHNFSPSLAVDVVLHPAHVAVRANPHDTSYPDLWDEETPDALATWAALEVSAKKFGLERVDFYDHVTKRMRRDLPHLQLPGWKGLVST